MNGDNNITLKEDTMRKLTIQGAILISIIAICVSSIAIALITNDNCKARSGSAHMMFDRPPPPPGMRGGGNEGSGRGGPQHQRGGRGEESKNFSRPERRSRGK